MHLTNELFEAAALDFPDKYSRLENPHLPALTELGMGDTYGHAVLVVYRKYNEVKKDYDAGKRTSREKFLSNIAMIQQFREGLVFPEHLRKLVIPKLNQVESIVIKAFIDPAPAPAPVPAPVPALVHQHVLRSGKTY
jgi:alcohol dehydrogenase class IV